MNRPTPNSTHRRLKPAATKDYVIVRRQGRTVEQIVWISRRSFWFEPSFDLPYKASNVHSIPPPLGPPGAPAHGSLSNEPSLAPGAALAGRARRRFAHA